MNKPNSKDDFKEITKPINLLKAVGSSVPIVASIVESKNQIESNRLSKQITAAELKLSVLESQIPAHNSDNSDNSDSSDWVKSVGEYSLRTVLMSIHYDGSWESAAEEGKEKFLCFGIGCITNEHEMITTDENIEIAEALIKQRGGTILITNGISTFKCLLGARSKARGIASVKIQRDFKRDKEIKKLMKNLPIHVPTDEIVKSKIKYSLSPYLGLDVGFLHISQTQNAYVSYFNFKALQFSNSVISYFQEPTNEVLKSFVTSPISSRILFAGSPIFDKNGYLLGVISETVRLEDEHDYRIIASGLLAHPSFPIDNK